MRNRRLEASGVDQRLADRVLDLGLPGFERGRALEVRQRRLGLPVHEQQPADPEVQYARLRAPISAFFSHASASS